MPYTTKEIASIEQAFSELLKLYKESLTKDINGEDKIIEAYQLSLTTHQGKYRKSGEPYLLNLISIAKTLVKRVYLDDTSFIAVLLYKITEDTSITIQQVEHKFGTTVAHIVNELAKLSRLKHQNNGVTHLDNLKKILLTLETDIRIILIKIVDRLYNVKTLDSLRIQKQQNIASETLYIYAPIAHLVGLYGIKEDLETLSLKYLKPTSYYDIKEKFKSYDFKKNNFIKSFSETIHSLLKSEGIDNEVLSRNKSIYSIYKKITEKQTPFENILDKFGLRIIYKSTLKDEHAMAWKIFSIIAKNYSPHPQRTKNYLNFPKTSGYEALHATVMNKGNWIEIQIRSERMDEIAERGYASHYKYKNQLSNVISYKAILEKSLELFGNRDLLYYSKFIDQFKNNLEALEINVFSPKGKKVILPHYGTVLDFAFKIHTQIGLKAKSARINNSHIVGLHHIPASGDLIEIITSEEEMVSQNWLDYLVTPYAIAKVKSALNQKEKSIIEMGHKIFLRKLKALKIKPSKDTINIATKFFSHESESDLFYTIAKGNLSNKKIHEFEAYYKSRSKLSKFLTAPNNVSDIIKEKDIIKLENHNNITYQVPLCCNPSFGSDIIGYLTKDQILEIHQIDCTKAMRIKTKYPDKILKPKWVRKTKIDFTIELKIISIDKLGIVQAISKILNKNQIKIIKLNFDSNTIIGKIDLKLYVKREEQFNKSLSEIKNVLGVRNLYIVEDHLP